SMPAARKSVPVSTMSMSLRPAPCIAFSLPGNSGAGALVKLNFDTTCGFFFWYASIASCVSARSPATSTMLMVTGLLGIGGIGAKALGDANRTSVIAVAAAARARARTALRGWDTFIWRFLLLVRDRRKQRDVRARSKKVSVMSL